MELSNLTARELIDVPLMFDKEDNPTDGFKVVGQDSPEYQKVDREYKLAGVKKAARRGRGIDAKTDTGAEELVNVLAKRDMALIVACTQELYGFTEDGLPAPLSEVTFEKIFKARPTWKAKVLAAIEEERGFTTA
jgi:hypothetical protein